MSDDRAALVRQRLAEFVEPYLGCDLVSAGAVRDLIVEGERVRVAIELGFPAAHYREALAEQLRAAVTSLPGIAEARVVVTTRIESHAVRRNLQPVGSIRNILAVASGKGGVGKSTVAANLALALAWDGARVGLLDADIYGPSQPRMMGLAGQRPTSREGRILIPVEAYGVKVMSIGFLIDEEQPMVWRGPMVTQALTQLIGDTDWGELDYLVVDMPPGTGDIQLTLSQRVPVSGAGIVTTPQDIALIDARKGLRMFQKVEVPVLGVVENMSTHICSQCGHEEHVFGAGGGQRMAERYDVPLLAELPLDARIREQADGGGPTVVAEPESALGQAFIDMARRITARLARQDAGDAFPSITVEDT
jgi:ATP-binding protein involved in chromosome partitioning